MAGIEDCIGVFLAATCGCCCLSCGQTDNLWCLFRAPGGSANYRVRSRSGMCCSCKRAMSDDDFERTVEQLYSPGSGPKPYDAQGNATHVVELQPTRTRKSREGGEDGEGAEREGRVTTQPGPRPSMEARRPRSRSPHPDAGEGGGGGGAAEPADERELAILESRKGAKDRTREWVARHRGPSDPTVRHQPSREGDGEGPSHRAHKSESHTQAPLQRPPEAYAQGRPSEPFLLPDLNVRGDGSLGRISAGSHGELGEGAAARSRPNIPAALMPGRPQGNVPSQLPFDLGPVVGLGLGPALSQVGGGLGSSPPGKEAGA